MGVVYRAVHLKLDRADALKVIGPQFADDMEFRSRFERESRVAAQIDHPNVIPIYHAGEDDGLLYIAMRLVEGHDVRAALLSEGRIEPRRAARIVDAVAAALDAAHARGLVHRDVKPANVLLARQGEREYVYLTDFGLAKMMVSGEGETKTGMFVGTTDYVSPEQVLGGPLDARSDVYSLGCMLFHMLTGSVPYPLAVESAKLVAHTQNPVPSALAIMPGLAPQFEAVIQRAMAKQPDDRYLSAGDLGRGALAAAEGRSVTRAETSVAKGAAAPTDVTTVSRLTQAAGEQPRFERTTSPRLPADPTVPAATRPVPGSPPVQEPARPATAPEAERKQPPVDTRHHNGARSKPRRRWLPAGVAAAVIVVVAIAVAIATSASSSHTSTPTHGSRPTATSSTAAATTSTSSTVAATTSTPSAAGSGQLTPASQLTTQNTTGSINIGQTATFALSDKGFKGPLVSVRAVSVNTHPVDQDDFLQGDPPGTTLVGVVFEVQSAVSADDVTDFIGFGGTDSTQGNLNPDTVVAGADCTFHNQTAGGPPITAGQLLTFCLLYDPEPRTHLSQVTASPSDTPQNLGIATATWNLR